MTRNRASPRDDPRSTDELIHVALTEPDDDTAWDAKIALQLRGTREVLGRALLLCRSECSLEHSLGAVILGQLGAPERPFSDERAAALLSMLDSEIDPEVLRSIFVAFGHLKTPGIIGITAEYAGHPDSDVRDGVVWALMGREDQEAIELLIVLTRDLDSQVRDWATFAIGTLVEADTPRIRAALVERLDDLDEDARCEAMIGLARRNDRRAIAAIRDALESGSFDKSLEAAEIIATPELLPALIALRDHPDITPQLLEDAIAACSPINSDMTFSIPKLSLVVLIGPSGSGKSTFARKHFLTSEVLSSDYCRGLVGDNENDQAATGDAFDVLNFIAAKRLARGRLTVIDATNVQAEARAPLVRLARQFHFLPVAIVFDLPESVCHQRNESRANRAFGPHVVRQQKSQLRRSLKSLKREGFRHVFTLDSAEQTEAASVERTPLWNDRSGDHGPFDIIGDPHGCAEELEELLGQLGYVAAAGANAADLSLAGGPVYAHPAGRKAIFVGDLVDRGPRVLDCLRIARNMVRQGSALCVPGNHDMKLLRKLRGADVQISHGLAQSLAEIEALPEAIRADFRQAAVEFLDSLVSHYVLDRGKLVVAHAGMKQEMQGRGSGRVRDFALYGETTGETDEFGLPVRHNWAAEYRGPAMVVYGHTPVPHPEWLNHTVNIDTGCVFGGRLTALRYPEREFVSVAAKRTYCESARPFLPPGERPGLSAQQVFDDVLDAEDVVGKRIVTTRLHHNVTIREENAAAALEVMSRFAANPKWLIYLPPTMSPCETGQAPGLLEHPAEAFSYFRSQGVPRVVCEEKHMGSRAVVVLCRDPDAARQRFGISDELGIVTTRTGRRFFNDRELERQLLERLGAALDAAGFWEEFQTTWVCLDCELMPWSAKAQELLRGQYAAVGAAGRAALGPAVALLTRAAQRLGADARDQLAAVRSRFVERQTSVERFVAAYRQYCWPVDSIDDLKLAPFHLLATEGAVHAGRSHVWHTETLAKICRSDPKLLLATETQVIDVTAPDSEREGVAWWESLTERGGEGMVVKPLEFVARGKRGLVQPAVKCRGREYLRIIYGPDYDAVENLSRLRARNLSGKRSLALREFALGIEALERFVRREPLRRVHECVFGVLALESEPVDPRL